MSATPVLDPDVAAVEGRLNILAYLSDAGQRAVRFIRARAAADAEDGVPMTAAKAWDDAARHVRRIGDGRALQLLDTVDALPHDTVRPAVDPAHALRVATGLLAAHQGRREQELHRWAVRLGWTWHHVHVMGAAYGVRTITPAPADVAAAGDLATAGHCGFTVFERSGLMALDITEAGETAWLLWHHTLRTGGHIPHGPEPRP